MIYIIPTKRGIGVELWGTREDLDLFYEVISKFWGDENHQNIKGLESRNKLISGFSYEIRKGIQGSRLTRATSHFSMDEQTHYGTEISWVHFLFSIAAIKYNMRFYETSKIDIAMILQIEFWLEKAMNSYDETGTRTLAGYIDDGLYGANDYIYQYMRSINLDYLLLGGGKRAFRQLPQLLKRGVYHTSEYQKYLNYLEKEAARLECEIGDLEIDDDHIDYELLKW